MFGTFATMFALWHREMHDAPGQVVDLAIYEPLFWLLGPQSLVYDQLGKVQGRTGSSTDWTAPRNVYKTRDDRWLGLSASSQSIAERVLRLVGHPEVVDEPWFADHNGRVENQHILDDHIGSWIAAHDYDEVLATFEAAHAVIGPVYTIADIFEDPQYQARDMLLRHEDPEFGEYIGPGIVPKLSRTPGAVRWSATWEEGSHNDEVYGGLLGLSDDELAALRAEGVV
jgi:crotonobetainyl-CoA:carnitine CoA-transferase CaiB-like acyl-CoA transferase